MKKPESKRQVTRVWLLAELNARLKRAEKLDAQCCGCRVKNLLPLPASGPANWAIELFDSKCEAQCLGQVTEIVAYLQQRCDVAW
ncbi:MAG: hypothetical protein JWR07_5503 [Nevskia sp.]|nr:hypothetical protein [Nevskia sp.]